MRLIYLLHKLLYKQPRRDKIQQQSSLRRVFELFELRWESGQKRCREESLNREDSDSVIVVSPFYPSFQAHFNVSQNIITRLWLPIEAANSVSLSST